MIDHITVRVADRAAAAYHRGYYAAFMLDPGGHNVEVIHDDPPGR